METIKERVPKAWIKETKCGITIDYQSGHTTDRHYNVTIKKDGNFYIVEGARANYEIFIDKEYSQEIVSTVVDEHICSPSASWLNFFSPKKYVKGWCELKEKTHTRYISNNITIIENIIW
jgi:hypothetical protein